MYSGADISNVIKEASFLPIRRKIKEQGGYGNPNENLKGNFL